MRTVLAVIIALALCGPAAAAVSGGVGDLSNMVATYHGVQAVRVIERFDSGAVATVDVLPQGQYRVATTGNPDPALVLMLATQPAPDLTSAANSADAVKSLGSKKLDEVQVKGYSIASPDGSYKEQVWYNQQDLPVSADVQTQGHSVNLTFGNYNDQMLIGQR